MVDERNQEAKSRRKSRHLHVAVAVAHGNGYNRLHHHHLTMMVTSTIKHIWMQCISTTFEVLDGVLEHRELF